MTDWLEVAQSLPLGHKRRIRHDCADGRDMIVSHNERGYSAYCFRCGPVGFEPHGYMNLADIERLRELNAQATEEHSNELPKDFTLEIPRQHVGWLLRAGIGPHLANRLRIGWSDSLCRVVLPIYSECGKELLYWQARAVLPGQTPKYINPSTDKSKILFSFAGTYARNRNNGVAITEDILSAIRVGRHVPACSALGTKLSESQSMRVLERAGRNRIFIWLDPDQAGRDGAKTMRRQLSLLSDKVQVVDSEADPKNISDRRIREILRLQPNHRYRAV